jgi:hypothetical protein
MLRPGDHIWAGVGQSPLLVAHEREDLPSRALRPLRLPNQDFVLHYQGKYYTTAVKTLTLPCCETECVCSWIAYIWLYVVCILVAVACGCR